MPVVETKDGETTCNLCNRILLHGEEIVCFCCKLKIDNINKLIGPTSKAKFIKEVEIIDPDTFMSVMVAIYKEESGGMLGVDSSYVAQEIDNVISPHGNGKLELVGD